MSQRACRAVHYEALDVYACGGHERMTGDEIDGFADGGVGVFKAVEPFLEIDAAMLHEGDMLALS